MDSVAEAVGLFGPKMSCAQAVLSSFGPQYGLDRDAAIRLGRGLGLGMGLGLACGAVSGAVLVLGLAEGPARENDREARFRCYDWVAEFADEFIARNGSLVCRELLGVDVATEQGRRQAQEQKLFETVCPPLVRSAAEILRSMLAAEGRPEETK